MRDYRLCLSRITRVALLSILAGCAPFGSGTSTPTRFYVLNSLYSSEIDTPALAHLPELTIAVGPVRLPQHLDRPHIVTRDSRNEIQVAPFAQWGESLQINFTRVMAENLSILLATQNIVIFPAIKAMPYDYQVTADITRFDGSPGADAHLRARWAIFDRKGKTLLYRSFSNFSEPSGSKEIHALIAAKSRAVIALSREIAGAIKALSDGQTAGQ